MSYIWQPLTAGSMTLRNRLVFPPMATARASEDGSVTDNQVEYYREKSHGGYIGLIIIEHSFIAQQGKASAGQLSVAEDCQIAGLSRIAEAIHSNGAKTMMQINHAGSMGKMAVTGCEVVGPSAVMNPNGTELPRALTKEEIHGIVREFAQAARRVQAAGFDGVEIHSAHAYFLNQFLSPLTNHRTDEYGGTLDNRIRLHLEVIQAVRAAVGPDFTVALRLGASDYMNGGTTIEDSMYAAQRFQEAGIDILDVTGGMCRFIVPGLEGQGYFAPLSRELEKVVSIPVILTGGITEGAAMEQLLQEHAADLIGVGRAVYQDSGWAERVMGR